MNRMNGNHYYDDSGGAETSVIKQQSAVDLLSRFLPLGNSGDRTHRRIAREEEAETVKDHYQAQFANTGILHTAALSAVADTMSDAVPSCEKYVRPIVGAYAARVIRKIVGC